MDNYSIRKFTPGDIKTVTDIFNYFVLNSFAAYPETELSSVFIENLREIAINGSFYVVETSAGEIIGFGLLRRYHASEVFRRAAELTYFIMPEHARKGLGSRLLEMLTVDARKAYVDTLLANISHLNQDSISFHKRHGFSECGRFRRMVRKNGKDMDIVWMQKFI